VTGGMDVAGGTLLAHASGSARQADNFTGLAKLLEQARVHDECFGPIGKHLADNYFTALEECQASASQAATYLEQVADALKTTAVAYGNTDTTNAAGLASASQGVGTLGDLNHSKDAEDERDSDLEQAARYGSSLADSKDQLQDAGTPVETGFALFNARMEQLNLVMSPGQALFDNGLGFLISLALTPLVELVIEPAIGDPEQMRATAKGWENVSKWLNDVAEHEDRRADATNAGWQGEAGDAFRGQMAEFADGARSLSGDVADLKQILEIAADLFDMCMQIVVDIIQEFVIGLIIEWLAALAASWITAGASLGVATATTSGQVAVTGGRLAKQVNKLRKHLHKLIKDLEELLVGLRQKQKVRQVLDRVDGLTNTKFVGGHIGRKMDGANPALGALRNHTDSVIEKGKQLGLRTKSGNSYIGKEAVGEEALAQRVVKAGLGYLGLGGSTRAGTVVITGTLENLPGAVETGAKFAEEKVRDPSSDEERQAAEQRGFTFD